MEAKNLMQIPYYYGFTEALSYRDYMIKIAQALGKEDVIDNNTKRQIMANTLIGVFVSEKITGVMNKIWGYHN